MPIGFMPPHSTQAAHQRPFPADRRSARERWGAAGALACGHRGVVPRIPASFAIGVELACAGSLVMLHVLFGRSPDTRVARVRALVLPPLVGLVVGGGADAAMHYGNHAMSLSLAGVELGGGASELLVIGLLSGSAGLLGALLLVPQVLALERARLETEMGTPEAAAAAERLGVVAWAVALGLAVLAWALARPSEIDVVRVLVAASATGVAGQWLRASRTRTCPPARVAATWVAP